MNQGFQQFLKHWYRNPGGRLLHEQESRLLESAIANLFGYFFVQLGCTSQMDWIEFSRVSEKLILDDRIDPALVKSLSTDKNEPHSVHWIKADLDYLPIDKESVDVMLLPHTLETVQDPYYILRQVDSMLMPEGHLVLTGFNPYACGILKNRFSKQGKAFREANLVRSQRVIEWLEVLGYDIEKVKYSTISCFAGTTSDSGKLGWRLLERLERALSRMGLQFGNVYCIVARKRVDAPRMVGLSWRRTRWFNWGKAPQLASRNAHKKQAESVTQPNKQTKMKLKESLNCK
ncbi:MAG: methyltransferase domain-containing protein [Thiomicrorhabdus chilensis]|uniref:class I SAM-dependent methyltransferase n=1 Tax=Thiomicrorhabdus chilensis TaxID=63656 RepID=UPI0004019885|nr:methyltransferase domain-containing protein [Thiomicrorhabdus chilensis]MDX1347509.1 methyltransferase domain-containing protein [Thiomicrorhabdus chilensis]